MRLFNALILDEHIEGTDATASCAQPWALFLPRAEALRFTCIVDEVAGASPTLSVWLVGGTSDWNRTPTTKILANGVSLGTSGNAFAWAFSPQDAKYPPTRLLLLYAQVGGTSKAHVRIWACGRGPEALDVVPAATPSFAAQYAAAKTIEDEDRLLSRKRLGGHGVSVLYPPELFLPSLHWER